mgnify:FL=1
MGKSKKSNRINVSKIVYAPITANTKESFTCGTVNDFGAVMTITLTPTIATAP